MSEPLAYLVCNPMVARQPVNARGVSPEITEWLYPASRAEDAKEFAKMMRADLIPLGPTAEVGTARAAAFEEAAQIAEARQGYDDDLQRSVGAMTAGESIAAAIRSRAALDKGATE